MWPFSKNKGDVQAPVRSQVPVHTLFLVVLDENDADFCTEAEKRLTDMGELLRMFGKVFILLIKSQNVNTNTISLVLHSNLEGCYYIEMLTDNTFATWCILREKSKILDRLFDRIKQFSKRKKALSD